MLDKRTQAAPDMD